MTSSAIGCGVFFDVGERKERIVKDFIDSITERRNRVEHKCDPPSTFYFPCLGNVFSCFVLAMPFLCLVLAMSFLRFFMAIAAWHLTRSFLDILSWLITILLTPSRSEGTGRAQVVTPVNYSILLTITKLFVLYLLQQ